ncbi:DNA helicase [Artemisia annua]|uniref:DNA helicase n=1 Tax=Artemisia annua TaxID=35608 RepID=A0A2U1MPI3_ARTAN|nr:DNA helicase [Artemisia annua]
MPNLWNPTYFQERAILAPTHDEVDKVNQHMMSMLPEEEHIYYSSDTSRYQVEDESPIPQPLFDGEKLLRISAYASPKGFKVVLLKVIRTKEHTFKELEVSTVDGFQGMEKETIINQLARQTQTKSTDWITCPEAMDGLKTKLHVMKFPEYDTNLRKQIPNGIVGQNVWTYAEKQGRTSDDGRRNLTSEKEYGVTNNHVKKVWRRKLPVDSRKESNGTHMATKPVSGYKLKGGIFGSGGENGVEKTDAATLTYLTQRPSRCSRMKSLRKLSCGKL